MRSSGGRSGGGRRPAAEGTAPGRWAARGPPRVRGWAPARPGLTMEGARGRGPEGRGPGPGAGGGPRRWEGQAGDAGGGGEAAGCCAAAGRREPREPRELPAGAEEGSGPGTPLRFPFRGARCRRALRFPREMAAPPPLAWAAPASRFAREKYIYHNHNNKKKKGDKSKVAATKQRAAAGARRRARRVRGAAGGTGPASPDRSPLSPSTPVPASPAASIAPVGVLPRLASWGRPPLLPSLFLSTMAKGSRAPKGPNAPPSPGVSSR